MFPWLDGLLEADLFDLVAEGVVVQFLQPDAHHASDFSGGNEILKGGGRKLGGEEHFVPEVDSQVGVVLAPDVVRAGLEGEGEGKWGQFQWVGSHIQRSLGEEVEEVVVVVRLEKSEASVEFDFALLSEFLGVVQVLGDTFLGSGSTEGGHLSTELLSNVGHAAVVLADGVHLGHGEDGGSDKALELHVGGNSGLDNLAPVLVGGVFRGEDEGGGGHADWSRHGSVFDVRHQVGDDGVTDDALGDGVVSVGGLDEAFVGKDGLGADESGVLGVLDDVFQLGGNFWESEDSDGGQEDSLLFVTSTGHDSRPQLVNDEGEDLVTGELWATESSRDFDGELGLGDAGVDTGLVGQRSKGQQTNLSVNLVSSNLLDGVLEHGDEGLGGESGVLWDSQEVVDLLDGVDAVVADKRVADGEGRGGSGNQESVVVQSVQTTGVGAFSFLDQRDIDSGQFVLGEGSDQSDDGAVFLHDAVDVKGLVVWLVLTEDDDDITEELLQTLSTLLLVHVVEFHGGHDLVNFFRGRR